MKTDTKKLDSCWFYYYYYYLLIWFRCYSFMLINIYRFASSHRLFVRSFVYCASGAPKIIPIYIFIVWELTLFSSWLFHPCGFIITCNEKHLVFYVFFLHIFRHLTRIDLFFSFNNERLRVSTFMQMPQNNYLSNEINIYCIRKATITTTTTAEKRYFWNGVGKSAGVKHQALFTVW